MWAARRAAPALRLVVLVAVLGLVCGAGEQVAEVSVGVEGGVAPGTPTQLGARKDPASIFIERSDPETGVKQACLDIGLRPNTANVTTALTFADVTVTAISGGITNKLFKCALTDAAIARVFPGEEAPSPAKTTVLVRWFGQNTEILIDRSREAAVMRQLTAQGFGCPMIGAFVNGRVEKFLHGYHALEPADFHQPNISTAIARHMGAMHRLSLAGDRKPVVWRTLRRWMALVHDVQYDTPQHQELLRQLNPARLEKEIQWLRRAAAKVPSPPVVCHNDLLPANVMLRDVDGDSTLIDFEYSDWNPRGYDIANHFLEHAGFECEWDTMLPSREHKERFYRTYYAALAQTDSLDGVDMTVPFRVLDREVQLYSLVSHMYWGVWGILQQRHSTIPFEYLPYSKRRIDRYLVEKAALLVNNPQLA